LDNSSDIILYLPGHVCDESLRPQFTQNTYLTSFWHFPHIYSTIPEVLCYLIIFLYKIIEIFLFYHIYAICPIHFITVIR